jgi:hypothetical protein
VHALYCTLRKIRRTVHITNKEIGSAWLDSREKRENDAFIAQNFQLPVALLSTEVLKVLKTFGYGTLIQERCAKGGTPFSMIKLQTLPEVDIPHETIAQEPYDLPPMPSFIRDAALDEIIQLFHVSRNPDKPGPMVFTGAHRPQLIEELRIREKALVGAGYKDLAYGYRKIHDITEPAVFAPESFAGIAHTPGTVPFYKFCAESIIWYYQNASPEVDMAIIAGVLITGTQLIASQSS